MPEEAEPVYPQIVDRRQNLGKDPVIRLRSVELEDRRDNHPNIGSKELRERQVRLRFHREPVQKHEGPTLADRRAAQR